MFSIYLSTKINICFQVKKRLWWHSKEYVRKLQYSQLRLFYQTCLEKKSDHWCEDNYQLPLSNLYISLIVYLNFLDLNALGILYLVRYKAWFQSISLQRKNENVAILIIKNCELVKVTCNISQSMFLMYIINVVHALKFLQIFAPYDD